MLEKEKETEVLTHCFTALRNRIIDSADNLELETIPNLLYLMNASFKYKDPLLGIVSRLKLFINVA